MDERTAKAVSRAYALMERTEEMLSEPRPEPRTGWQPRQVERPSPAPEPSNVSHVTHLPAAMLTRQFAAHVADYKRDRAAFGNASESWQMKPARHAAGCKSR